MTITKQEVVQECMNKDPGKITAFFENVLDFCHENDGRLFSIYENAVDRLRDYVDMGVDLNNIEFGPESKVCWRFECYLDGKRYEFWDFKTTSTYSDDNPSPTACRFTPIIWSVRQVNK